MYGRGAPRDLRLENLKLILSQASRHSLISRRHQLKRRNNAESQTQPLDRRNPRNDIRCCVQEIPQWENDRHEVPGYVQVEWSEAQTAQRARFKQAVAYARAALA